jgi:hypothetical protein
MTNGGLFDRLPADWFDKIIGLIRDCLNNEPSDSIASRLKSPGRREYVQLWRHNRKMGLRRPELRRETDADWQALLSATHEELEDIVAEADAGREVQ